MSVVMVSLLRWLRLISVCHAIEQPKAIAAVALVFNYGTGLIARRDTDCVVRQKLDNLSPPKTAESLSLEAPRLYEYPFIPKLQIGLVDDVLAEC